MSQLSTDIIYRGTDSNLILTDELDRMDARIVNIDDNKSPLVHVHHEYITSAETIPVMNTQLTGTSSNGSISIVANNCNFVNNTKYIVSIKYTNGNTLVDQSLYTFIFNTSKRLCPTFNLVKCNNSTDTLLATQTDGLVTFAMQYNGSGETGATLTII